MERVKDLSKGKLRGDGVLVRIVERESKSDLILPDSVKDAASLAEYIQVIAVGNKVDDIAPGDIILDVGGEISTFVIKDHRYGMLFRGTILYAVDKDNFDFDYKAADGDGLSL